MGPAALLSVLVEANSSEATTKLSKFDKQLAATNTVAQKGIHARLGADFNASAFNAYDQRLSRAARVARDRAAFKAELGANFNNSAFNAYERGIDKANKATTSVAAHADHARHSFSGLAKGLLEAGGAFVAFEAAKSAIDSTLELSHATERLTAVTGMDAKAGSQWLEVMKVRGVAAHQGIQGFISLSKQIKAAEDGTTKNGGAVQALSKKQQTQLAVLKASGASQKSVLKLQISQVQALAALSSKSDKANAAFKELGVSQAALKSGNITEILKQAADGLKNIDNPARRAALSQQLFGRGAQALIPILAEGSKGVDEALAATQRYGAYLPANVKQMEAARQANFKLQYAMDGLKITFTQKVLPALVAGAGRLLDFISQMRNGTGAGGQFASAIKTAFNIVKGVVTTVVGAVGGIGNALEIAIGVYALRKVSRFAHELGAVAGLIRKGPGLASRAWGLVTGSGGGHGIAGARSLSTSVATMEVAEMFVKSMHGGGGGGSSSPAKTVLHDAESAAKKAVPGAALLTAAQQFARLGLRALPGVGTAAALVAAQEAIPGRAALPGIGSKLPAPGLTPRSGIPALLSAIGNAGQAIAGGKPLPGRFDMRSVPNEGATIAFARLKSTAQESALAVKVLGAQGASTFALLSTRAAQMNQIPFSFGDRVASSLLRAHGATRSVVSNMLATLHKLPVGAQVEAANTAIGLAAQLEAKHALPVGSADRIRAAIVASFTQMRVDSVAQASGLVTDTAKMVGAFGGSLQGFVSTAAAAFAKIGGLAAKAAAAVPAVDFTKPGLGLPGFSALTKAPPAGTHLKGAKAAPTPADPLAKLIAELNAQTKADAAAAKAAKKVKVPKVAKVPKPPAATPIPSQLVGAQTQMALLSNQLTNAQNANNTAAQAKALNAEIKLERSWVVADNKALARVNKALADKHLSRAKHLQLLQDRLAIIQEIGTVSGQIGSNTSTLKGLAGAASVGSFDLAPGGNGIKLPTVYDVHNAMRSTHALAGPHKGIMAPIGARGGVTNHHTWNVHISRDVDIHKVGDEFERVAAGQLDAQLRAAGFRGS